MIWSSVAAAVRSCVRFTRRRVAVAPAEPPRLTMEQVTVLLRPRTPVVRRAVAIGCPAAALPTVAIPPVLPVPPPPVPPSVPLPFGIGTGQILPPLDGLPGIPTLPVYDVAGPAAAAAGVPEPGALAVLLVAIAMLACLLLWRRA